MVYKFDKETLTFYKIRKFWLYLPYVLLTLVTVFSILGFTLYNKEKKRAVKLESDNIKKYYIISSQSSIIAVQDSILEENICIEKGIQKKLTGIPDSAMILHTIMSETGNLGSSQFKRNRNLFGFHNGKGYLKFKSWKDSLEYFMSNFYYGKNGKKQDESYCAFLKRRKFGDSGGINYCMVS